MDTRDPTQAASVQSLFSQTGMGAGDALREQSEAAFNARKKKVNQIQPNQTQSAMDLGLTMGYPGNVGGPYG